MQPPQTDRRRFLIESSSLLAGSALSLAALANEPTGEKVRLGVVGTGARGSDLIRALTTIEAADIVAVCDDYAPHLERGGEFAGPQAQRYASFSQLLKDARPQAVVVAVPLHRHAELCLEALDAGCDVFCEKTMTYNLDQAQQLAAAVAKHQAVFQVGLQRRANAVYRQAAAMVQTGMLGQIAAIKCQWHRNNNWRRPVPVPRADPRFTELEHRLNWRLYRDSSHGLMTELASHQLDVANWLLGGPPRRALGSGGIDYWHDGREVFDNVFCIYEYDGPQVRSQPGRITHSTATTNAAAPSEKPQPYTVRVTYSSLHHNAYEGASELIMGSRGTLFLTQKKGLFYREGAAEDPGWSKDGRVKEDAALLTAGKTLKMTNDPWAHRGAPYEIDAHGDDTRDELLAFLDCVIRRDPATICDVHHGMLDTATVLIGDQAMREQIAIDFPPGIV